MKFGYSENCCSFSFHSNKEEENKDKCNNPFMPNGISHCYHLEQSISVLRDVHCWVVFLIFIQILIEHSASKQWRP